MAANLNQRGFSNVKPTVFIPESIAPAGLDMLHAHCRCVMAWEESDNPVTDPRIQRELYRADAILVRMFRVTGEDIAQMQQLKVIAKHGAGVDNIDCRAATVRGIPVVNTPEAVTTPVAEHTLALMLALSRQIASADLALRQGTFRDRRQFLGVELAGRALGILGLGRIGSRVAEMASLGLGMKVYAYDPYLVEGQYSGPAGMEGSLESLLEKVDFLTVHVPLTGETKHLINSETLKRVKPGCRIINTSRGGVVDGTALVAALEDGRLGGAALDVFEKEPLQPDDPLCSAPNTLLTPHIASSTPESLDRISLQAAQGVLDVLQGRKPRHVVNPEVL